MKAALLALALLTSAAHAELPAPTTLGLHIGTRHSQQGMQDFNPGAYAVWANGATAGTYRNSENGISVYAGRTWQWDYFGVTAGAITGYRRAAVLPLLVPSLRLPIDQTTAARLTYVPKHEKGGTHALHLSLEFKL